MTPDEFRELALALPDVSEGAHMGHADFRVGGKIFATLGYPDADHGVVILPADAQQEYLKARPATFGAASGAWGERGATNVRLSALDVQVASDALESAWRKRAPKRLTKQFDHPHPRS